MITRERGIEQHSKFLLHTLQVPYMCTLCDSTNINTKMEFVPNCSMSVVMVSMVVHRHLSKLHSKQHSTNITHHFLH